MEQSPSWEANWLVASQEIPRIFMEPEGSLPHSHRPPPVPILSQPNPVHTPTSHLLEIHRDIIYPNFTYANVNVDFIKIHFID